MQYICIPPLPQEVSVVTGDIAKLGSSSLGMILTSYSASSSLSELFRPMATTLESARLYWTRKSVNTR